jgi:hypothetical protein
MVPTPPEELTLRYGGELGSDINLQEEININLIDLDALRVRLSESLAEQQFNVSLQECILIALEENMDIQITEYEPLKSDEAIYSAKGEFDPVRFLQPREPVPVPAGRGFRRHQQRAVLRHRHQRGPPRKVAAWHPVQRHLGHGKIGIHLQ